MIPNRPSEDIYTEERTGVSFLWDAVHARMERIRGLLVRLMSQFDDLFDDERMEVVDRIMGELRDLNDSVQAVAYAQGRDAELEAELRDALKSAGVLRLDYDAEDFYARFELYVRTSVAAILRVAMGLGIVLGIGSTTDTVEAIWSLILEEFKLGIYDSPEFEGKEIASIEWESVYAPDVAVVDESEEISELDEEELE